MINNYDVVRSHMKLRFLVLIISTRKFVFLEVFHYQMGPEQEAFTTPDKKAHFTVNELPKEKIATGNFIMMTIRTHDQYNTTIYGMDDRYRGISNERRVILMNPSDMKKKGFQQEQIVSLTSHFNGEERKANNFKIVSYNIPEGCIASYFPETNVFSSIK